MQPMMLVYSVVISFVINILICPFMIKYLRILKFGQQVRNDGPKTHLKKANTPTMGGIIFLISMTITSLFFLRNNHEGILVLLSTIGFGLIGFTDDFIKIIKKRSLGLHAYQKIILQIIMVAFFLLFINKFLPEQNYSQIYIPFVSKKFLELGIFFIPFIFFVFIGTVNAVNLTDGLDGLAAGVTVLVSIFFMYIALKFNNPLCLIAGSVVGSLFSFLLFNSYPAKVFMGDAGAFALGGFIASIAIVLKAPLFLIIVGIIYIAEALSVIIQVAYFKITHGKRFFKMAPIHHHFELCGWSETKVVAMFYLVTAIMCLIGLVAFKF